MDVRLMTDNFSPDQPEELKTRFLSLSPEQLDALRLSYSYRLLQAGLRDTGWINLFLGGLTFFLGIGIPGNPVLKALQAFFGISIVLVSMWSIVSPVVIAVAVWTIVFGISGLWNIFIAFSESSLIAGILGLLQLWWTYQLFLTFRKNSQTAKPGAETLRLYDLLQRTMQRFNIDIDPDSIQLMFNRRWWQGFLLQDRVVLASRQGIALLLAERSKTTFTFRDGKGILRNRIVGTFDLGGISAKRVTFPRSTFERCSRWNGLSNAQIAEWLNALDLSAKRRLPIRIAVILLMVTPIAFMLFWAILTIVMVATYGK